MQDGALSLLKASSRRCTNFTLSITLNCKGKHPKQRGRTYNDRYPTHMARCKDSAEFYTSVKQHVGKHREELPETGAVGSQRFSLRMSTFCDREGPEGTAPDQLGLLGVLRRS